MYSRDHTSHRSRTYNCDDEGSIDHPSHKRKSRVYDDDGDSGRHRSPRRYNCRDDDDDDDDGARRTAGRDVVSRSRNYSRRAHRDRDYDRLRPQRDRDLSSLPKLCLISSCPYQKLFSYNLHILDLDYPPRVHCDDDQFILTPPALRLDPRDFAWCTFCVFNSVLYIFDSKLEEETSVFVINLTTIDYKHSSITTGKSRLTVQSDLEKVGDLLQPKQCPIATLTPDRKKILVFSSSLNRDCFCRSSDCDFEKDPIEFELYDPSKQTSERIPGIAHTSRKPFKALGFTFIGESVFALHTEVGLYVIDLHLLHQGWKTPDVSFITRIPRQKNCGDHMFVIDGGSRCVTPNIVYEIDDQQEGEGVSGENTSSDPHERRNELGTTYSLVPTSKFDGHLFHERHQPRIITQLHPNNNLFAVSTSANHKETEHPHLIVDIIECCNKKPKLRRSVKFRLDGLPCDDSFPFYLLPIC